MDRGVAYEQQIRRELVKVPVLFYFKVELSSLARTFGHEERWRVYHVWKLIRLWEKWNFSSG